MSFYADLHIHSRYSRATSKELTLPQIHRYALIKGLTVLGTGDCTHPGWRQEISQMLKPTDDGLLALKKEFLPQSDDVCAANHNAIRFMITGEISTIYKCDGKTRKVHHIVCLPTILSNEKFCKKLQTIGNIHSDGRPILGVDSRDLLEILLEASSDAVLIPAHIWTPWFSVLGSKSGFDSIEECYKDLSSHIFALETGLSSDPPMNWSVSKLDKYTLVSNSDAHSLRNLGREATVFSCKPGYSTIMQALRNGVSAGYGGTLEFFPEEGKYHHDGHRNCSVCFSPKESIAHKGLCPVCHTPLTLGVAYRVAELADKKDLLASPHSAPFNHIVSLESILAEIAGTKSTSVKVQKEYFRLIQKLGPELNILLTLSIAHIEKHESFLLASAINSMRKGTVFTKPGFDGQYGEIMVLDKKEKKHKKSSPPINAP